MKSKLNMILILLFTVTLCSAQSTDMMLNYIDPNPPSLAPKVFAPDFISQKNEYEFGSVFNRDVTEFFYSVTIKGKSEIRYTKLEGNSWTKPITILSHDKWGCNDPFLSPDEKRLYFISRRTMDGTDTKEDYDIWYVERMGNQWSEPINAGSNINSNHSEYYISFSRDGTMYFSSNKGTSQDNEYDFDIYSSKYIDGEFQEPERLGDSINTPSYEADVFIDPDEKYIIFCADRTEGLGQGDLYISFKKEDGSWTTSQNMGAPINSNSHELCPFVTSDGKYLFYTSKEDIYWVSTDVIYDMREKSK